MAFIIGGHPRSGTTMLFRLLHHHPEIGITGEFKCFSRLDNRFPAYFPGLERKWYRRGFIRRTGRNAPWKYRLQSGVFLWRYCLLLALRVGYRPITAKDVEAVLHQMFHKPVVGDKYPRYVFRLDKLSAIPDLKRVMIYRDGRDVVSSFLYKIRTAWKDLRVAQTENTATRIAERWVESVENIERYRESLLVIRYEEFVRNPSPTILSLGDYLGVEPAGFSFKRVHDNSIGKFRSGLTSEELRDVMAVAGDTLDRLGYLGAG